MSPELENRLVGDRPKWILRLLYAPVKGKESMPIVGTTRLMKGCFLLDRRFSDELNIATDFDFHPDKYGPLDPKVYEAVDHLEDLGLLEVEDSEKYEGVEYILTKEGKTVGRREFEEMDEEARELLSWIKSKHVLSPLPKLLSFVYNQYPQMAKESRLT